MVFWVSFFPFEDKPPLLRPKHHMIGINQSDISKDNQRVDSPFDLAEWPYDLWFDFSNDSVVKI